MYKLKQVFASPKRVDKDLFTSQTASLKSIGWRSLSPLLK